MFSTVTVKDWRFQNGKLKKMQTFFLTDTVCNAGAFGKKLRILFVNYYQSFNFRSACHCQSFCWRDRASKERRKVFSIFLAFYYALIFLPELARSQLITRHKATDPYKTGSCIR